MKIVDLQVIPFRVQRRAYQAGGSWRPGRGGPDADQDRHRRGRRGLLPGRPRPRRRRRPAARTSARCWKAASRTCCWARTPSTARSSGTGSGSPTSRRTCSAWSTWRSGICRRASLACRSTSCWAAAGTRSRPTPAPSPIWARPRSMPSTPWPARRQGYTHYKIHPYYFWDPVTQQPDPGRPSHID